MMAEVILVSVPTFACAVSNQAAEPSAELRADALSRVRF